MRGSFDLPAGSAWTRNTERVAKYVNKQAPSGPSPVRQAVIKTGKKLRLLARSLGDSPVDLVTGGTPDGPVCTAYTVANGVEAVFLALLPPIARISRPAPAPPTRPQSCRMKCNSDFGGARELGVGWRMDGFFSPNRWSRPQMID